MKFRFPRFFYVIIRSCKFIVRKKLYFTVPIAGLTVMNWVNFLKIRTLENDVEEKTELVNEVMLKVVMNNYDINDIPFPAGFKIYDRDKKIIRGAVVNNAYQLKHGFGTSTYFGQSDIKMDDVNGPQWMKNDLKVLEGAEMKVNKFVEGSNAGDGNWYKWWRNKNTSPKSRYVRLYFIEI